MATINELASRITGVAPLSVFFDAVNTVGVTQPPLVLSRREYADFDYTWGFGDPASGLWAVSGKQKNIDSGCTAAHVFEVAGTYNVTVAVKDGATVNETHDVTITVTDPNVIYSGTNTICVSTSGDFAGAPSGSTQLTTTVIDDIFPYISAGRRILFKRGESWTTSTVIQINNSDVFTIGAYGSGTNPDSRGIFSNAPIINVGGGAGDGLFLSTNQNDSRIMDLNIIDAGTRATCIDGITGLTNHLYFRNKITGFNTAVNIGYWATGGHDSLSFVDNDVSGSYGNILYVGSERLAILGNSLRDTDDSHVCRVWQAY